MLDRVRSHLEVIYPGSDIDTLAAACVRAIGIDEPGADLTADPTRLSRWDESDAICITYGDSLTADDERPLATLRRFAVERLDGLVSTIHVLPFFPSSSDFGFSVIDYHAVAHQLGDWGDIKALAKDFDLMVDLILNHTSAESAWFQQFLAGELPGSEFFMTADPNGDYSSVVRPRAKPLLHEVDTADGLKNLWCTFSSDQVDLDFSNPDVLLEHLRIVDRYLAAGARFLRLDAVAFIWKELGTTCVHLPETHEIVKLLHTLLESRAPRTVLITETNVPNDENLSYFGASDEAHMVYNFSLPPLTAYGLLNGSSAVLRKWSQSVPAAPSGCTYLNFLASHDGIGVRAAEGILSNIQIDSLVSVAHQRGGSHSSYSSAGGDRPYELNVSLFDLLSGLPGQEPADQVDRFVCAHAIMLALEGIPALYIHSLLGTPNDCDTVSRTGVARSINRAALSYDDVCADLDQPESTSAQIFKRLSTLLRLRRQQPAFHPNAPQSTLDLADTLFGIRRSSKDGRQTLFAIHNLTNAQQVLDLEELGFDPAERWHELLSGRDLSGTESLSLESYGIAWISNR